MMNRQNGVPVVTKPAWKFWVATQNTETMHCICTVTTNLITSQSERSGGLFCWLAFTILLIQIRKRDLFIWFSFQHIHSIQFGFAMQNLTDFPIERNDFFLLFTGEILFQITNLPKFMTDNLTTSLNTIDCYIHHQQVGSYRIGGYSLETVGQTNRSFSNVVTILSCY